MAPLSAFTKNAIATLGEFVGTTMFLFLALGGAKTALKSQVESQLALTTSVALGNQTIIYIALCFGLSLLVSVWMFYRITGGLFNPAITLALYLVGAVPGARAIPLFFAQMAGGVAASGLVAALTPFGGVEMVQNTLGSGISTAQGLFIEALMTTMLVFCVLMLAAEKHRATFMAPLVIGLTLFVCHLFAIQWTGCGMNPARAFGPSLVSASFVGYHWIYWLGPFLGALIAVGFYTFLKSLDYRQVAAGQDDDRSQGPGILPVHQKMYNTARTARRFVVFHDAIAARKGGPDGLDAETGEPYKKPTVVGFNVHDEAQMAAVRAGEATVVDLPPAEFDDAVGLHAASDVGPSMAAQRQDMGATDAPASARSGLVRIGPIGDALSH